MRKIMPSIIVILLLMSVVAMAVGTSTGSTSPSTSGDKTETRRTYESDKEERTTTKTTAEIEKKPEEICEDSGKTKERIKCRLEKRVKAVVVPEACRVLKSPTSCIALYKNIQTCYQKTGRTKDQCFKEKVQFSRENRESVKNYLATLLYDLQERVEDAYGQNKIDAEAAADLINLIVEIKQSLLLNEPKSAIVGQLNQLKSKWRSEMG